MKKFFENYGGVTLGICSVLVLVAMVTPVGAKVKDSLTNIVSGFSSGLVNGIKGAGLGIGEDSKDESSESLLMPGSLFKLKLQDNYGETTELVFTDIAVPEGVGTVDYSANSDGSILGWVSGDTYYISSLESGKKVIANSDCKNMFSNLTFTTIDLTNLDLSNADVTNMLNNTSNLQKVIVADETTKIKLVNGSTGVSNTKLIKIDGELEVVKTVTINNDRLNATTLDTVEIKFTSNGNQYVGISYIKRESDSEDTNPSYDLYYLTKIDNSYEEGGPGHVAYTYRDETHTTKNGNSDPYYCPGWTNEAYKTIEFYEEPTSDLLNWLNANMTTPTSYNISFKVVVSEHGLTDVTMPKEIQDIANSTMTSTSSTATFREIENSLPYTSVVYEKTYFWYFSDHIKTTQLGNEIVYTLKWYCMNYQESHTTQALANPDEILLINANGEQVKQYTITYSDEATKNRVTSYNDIVPTTIRNDETVTIVYYDGGGLPPIIAVENADYSTSAFGRDGEKMTISNPTNNVIVTASYGGIS